LWPGGVVVRALDLQLKGRGCYPRPFGFQLTILGKLFTSVTKQYNLVPVEGR